MQSGATTLPMIRCESEDTTYLAERCRRGSASNRLQQLPFFRDVIEWVTIGLPDLEIAKRIQKQGYLLDVTVDAVRMQVMRYRHRKMKLATVANRRMSNAVVQAAKALEDGVDEARELQGLFIEQYRALERLDFMLEDITAVMNLGDSANEETFKYLKAYTALYRARTATMAEARKVAAASAALKADMGVLHPAGPVAAPAVIEAVLAEVVQVTTRLLEGSQPDLNDPQFRTQIVDAVRLRIERRPASVTPVPRESEEAGT